MSKRVPGAVDVHVHQVMYAPELRVNIDRTRAQNVNLTESNVANSMLYALAGSGTATPNYWLNPQNGVNYAVVVQVPQYQLDSGGQAECAPDLARQQATPVEYGTGSNHWQRQQSAGQAQMLSNVAQIQHTSVAGHHEPLQRAAGV